MRIVATLLPLFLTVSSCGSSDATESQPVGLEIGYRAPTLEGLDAGEQPLRIDGATGRPHVIVFYTSASCGLCRVQLERMQQHLPAYERANASLTAVSLDPPPASRVYAEGAGISYPLVSVDSATFLQWAPIDASLGSPLPAAYILDGAGTVRFRHIGRNSSDRMSDAGMIAILSELDAP